MKTSMLLGIVTLVSSATAAFLPTTEALNVQLKTQTFMSPPFFLCPGGVANKWYYNVDFPRGNAALKSFNGEVADEAGAPVPLHETYHHHWLVSPYYGPSTIPITNSGPCKDSLGQYFGLGSETQQTPTWVLDPYGIEIGAPAPARYDERWLINVHARDTRGAADKLACSECKCDVLKRHRRRDQHSFY